MTRLIYASIFALAFSSSVFAQATNPDCIIPSPATPNGVAVNGGSATGKASYANGIGAQANGDFSHASGTNAVANKNGIAIGTEAHATDCHTTAVGHSANASGTQATASGGFANASAFEANASGFAANASGFQSTATGARSNASAAYTTANGHGANATHRNSVALGANSQTTRPDEVNVGNRVIGGVNAGVWDNDAVNLRQMRQADEWVLNNAKIYTDNRIKGLHDKIDRVGAMSTAMAMMSGSASAIPSEHKWAVGVGNYNGADAIAIGYQRAWKSKNQQRPLSFTIGGAFAGSNRSVGAGFGMGF